MKTIQKNSIKLAQLLVDVGATIDGKNKDKVTPIEFAIDKNKPDMVEYLLANGADVNQVVSKGISLIHYAHAKGNRRIVDILLAYNANIHSRDANGEPFYMDKYVPISIMEKVLNAGININYRPPSGACLLSLSIMHHEHKKTDLLLARNVDIDSADAQGMTPLMIAAIYDNIPAVKKLLQKGVSIDAGNTMDTTSLMCAALYGRLKTVELLLVHGASSSYINLEGLTALDFAYHRPPLCPAFNLGKRVGSPFIERGAEADYERIIRLLKKKSS